MTPQIAYLEGGKRQSKEQKRGKRVDPVAQQEERKTRARHLVQHGEVKHPSNWIFCYKLDALLSSHVRVQLGPPLRFG